MSTGQRDEQLEQSRPAQAVPEITSRSRFQTILRTMIAVVLCCGVLGWIVHTVLSNSHAVKEAIRAMKSRDPADRVGAIQKLETAGRGNGRIAIPPLIVALGDENGEVRKAAAMALGPIGIDSVNAGSLNDAVRGAIAALLGALRDPQPAVRVAAANALASIAASEKAAGLIDSKAAVATLTECLGDREAEFRWAALGLLAVVAPASGVDPPKELAGALKDESAGNRSAAVIALINFPRGLDPWIPALLQMMADDKAPGVRVTFNTRIAGIHPPAISVAAIPTLIAALSRPDGEVRAAACRILMSFGSEARAAIPALIAMARETWSDSPDVERRRLNLDRLAIQALTKIALKTESVGQVVAALTELVQEKSRNRCEAAVEALGEFGPTAESAVPDLIRALPWKLPPPANSPPFLRSAVIQALGRIASGPRSSGDAIAALRGVVRTGGPGMQPDAAEALGDFGPAAESAVPDLIRAIEEAAREKRYLVSWRASVALGRIAPGTKSAGDAIAALHRLLRTRPPEPNFQIAAAEALGEFGPAAEPAVPDLIQILKESTREGVNAQVRRAAEEALARIEGHK